MNNMNTSNFAAEQKTQEGGALEHSRSLVWNADLDMRGLSVESVLQRRQAIDEARRRRPRTARIEQEIIIAVIVLYAAILLTFAALHLYGRTVYPPETSMATSVAWTINLNQREGRHG